MKTLPYFGKLDPDNLENFYDTQAIIYGKEISLDINLDLKSPIDPQFEMLENALNQLEKVILDSLKWIRDDYRSGTEVKEYMEFHLDDFYELDIEELLLGTDPSLSNEERFLQTLHLDRVGFYTDNTTEFMVLDYMTKEDISNYILVIVTDADLNFRYMTTES